MAIYLPQLSQSLRHRTYSFRTWLGVKILDFPLQFLVSKTYQTDFTYNRIYQKLRVAESVSQIDSMEFIQ